MCPDSKYTQIIASSKPSGLKFIVLGLVGILSAQNYNRNLVEYI